MVEFDGLITASDVPSSFIGPVCSAMLPAGKVEGYRDRGYLNKNPNDAIIWLVERAGPLWTIVALESEVGAVRLPLSSWWALGGIVPRHLPDGLKRVEIRHSNAQTIELGPVRDAWLVTLTSDSDDSPVQVFLDDGQRPFVGDYQLQDLIPTSPTPYAPIDDAPPGREGRCSKDESGGQSDD